MTERPFRFVSVPTTISDKAGDTPDGMGTIELKIWLCEIAGETRKRSKETFQKRLSTLNQVNEKTAKKHGLNVRVCGTETKKRSIAQSSTYLLMGSV